MSSEIWLGVVGAGASKNITVNLNGALSNGGEANIAEYSGIASSPLDQTAYADSISGTTSTGTTASTTVSKELWIGSVCVDLYSQTTPQNGFTLFDGVLTNSVSNAYLEKNVSSTGTASSGTTLGGSANYVGVIATFKVA
jgi:hypothetical protein